MHAILDTLKATAVAADNHLLATSYAIFALTLPFAFSIYARHVITRPPPPDGDDQSTRRLAIMITADRSDYLRVGCLLRRCWGENRRQVAILVTADALRCTLVCSAWSLDCGVVVEEEVAVWDVSSSGSPDAVGKATFGVGTGFGWMGVQSGAGEEDIAEWGGAWQVLVMHIPFYMTLAVVYVTALQTYRSLYLSVEAQDVDAMAFWVALGLLLGFIFRPFRRYCGKRVKRSVEWLGHVFFSGR